MNVKMAIISTTMLLCLFGVFGWPTPYRYEVLWEGVTDIDSGLDDSDQVIYRINRWTGYTERLAPLPRPSERSIVYRYRTKESST